MASSNLLNDKKYTLSNPYAHINWNSTYSAVDIGNVLGVGINGDNFGIFSNSVAGKFIRNAIDTRNILHFNYVQSIGRDAIYKITGLGRQILSKSAKALLEDGEASFTRVCGDSVVRTATLGGVLVVNVAVEFENMTWKEKFDNQVTKPMSISNIVDIVRDFSKKYNVQPSIKVTIHQFGGDTSKLSEIFGKSDADGNYSSTICSLSDQASISHCTSFINNIIGYHASGAFYNSINFNHLNNLYIYDYGISSYRQMGVKGTDLPALTDEQKASLKYLTNSITEDRNMLQYLQTYQKQPFYNKFVNQSTKADIEETIYNYQKMLENYNHYQIVDSCYADIDNINTRCVYAANEVKKMRSKYQSSIDIAQNMTYTIPINTPIGNIKLISINAGNICSLKNNECQGIYLSYSSATDSFNDTRCLLDTTPGNLYFNTINSANNLVGKSVFCDDGFYVKRTEKYYNDFGIAGRLVNGKEVDYDTLNRLGYNSQFFYSGSSLLYNPI